MPRKRRDIPWLEWRGETAYVCRYDANARRTERLSLRTTDPVEAQKRYAAFLIDGHDVLAGRPRGGSSELTLGQALDDYWREHVAKKVVDTKRAIKQVAGFSSNKLDWLCKQLGLGAKIEHEGFPLWQACGEKNDPAAWRRMARYNKHDVKLLGELYETIAPWIRQPGTGVYVGDERCVNPACRSADIEWRGLSRQVTRTYRRFQCRRCGKWGRAVLAERTPRAVVTQAL